MSSDTSFPVEYSDLRIDVLDQPSHGGAHHEYAVTNQGNVIARISFQNGPINEFGVNGVTNEALLLAVAHRLRSFQAGPYVCDENRLALEHIEKAVDALYSRTKSRQERGVEGTRQL
jgi:hypothetical protein